MNILKNIPLAAPDIRLEDIKAVELVLKSGMLVQGQKVLELEQALAQYLGVAECIATTNGTSTLHLSLIAERVGPGDEVIVPAFSYVATANVVEMTGATPVFVDIDIRTFNIDVHRIEQAISERTKAIMPVHEFGLMSDMDAIMNIAQRYDLKVIEDAACALGAEYKDKKAGTIGLCGSFSFHPRKAITSGEGGVVSTNDIHLAKRLRTLRNHGIGETECGTGFVAAGLNCRMTDFQAALLISQLGRFHQILEKKEQLAKLYFGNIRNPLITLPTVPEGYIHTWQTFHVLLDESIEQNYFLRYLKENGIGSNYGAQCIPAQVYYKNKYQLNAPVCFPNAYRAYKKGLALPLYEKLDFKEVEYICNIVNQYPHVN